MLTAIIIGILLYALLSYSRFKSGGEFIITMLIKFQNELYLTGAEIVKIEKLIRKPSWHQQFSTAVEVIAKRMNPRSDWTLYSMNPEMAIREIHQGFIDWVQSSKGSMSGSLKY